MLVLVSLSYFHSPSLLLFVMYEYCGCLNVNFFFVTKVECFSICIRKNMQCGCVYEYQLGV